MQKITERHVQAIWYDRKLRPDRLITRRGSEVRVVHPGEWNLGPGPDFKKAVLEMGRDRKRIVGDVEVHVCPSDWDFHGHGADSRYRNVIAHVTWNCGPEPKSLPADAISIWLGRMVMSNPTFSLDQIDLLAYPFAMPPDGGYPCETRIAHNPEVARRILAKAGKHRLRMKAKMLMGRLSEAAVRKNRVTESQVFYEEAMTALGYSHNSEQFRHVAERVPIAELPQDADAARTMLLVAGEFEEWNRTTVRPNNSPKRRLARAASIFCETPMMKFRVAADFSRKECLGMIRAMCGDRYLGKGRAAAIVANVIVPFAMACGRINELPDWLPPEDISESARRTAMRLFGRDHNPMAFYADNGLLVQGLLQINRDFCLKHHPICEDCALPQLRAG